MKRIYSIWRIALTLSLAFASVSCDKDGPQNHIPNVIVLYSAGANNLGLSMDDNIEEISAHYLPVCFENNKVVVVSQRRDESRHLEPAVITRLYRDDSGGTLKKEIMAVLPGDVNIADADGFVYVMNYLDGKYPSAKYSMIFSSHGTGWIPACYKVDDSLDLGVSAKSVGDSDIKDQDTGLSFHTSIDIREMADRSPVHFECIVFDACLMGGVEVAYELKDIADRIIFSQAEIEIRGIDYDASLRRLLAYDKPDYDGLCRDYIHKYNGSTMTVTISMVECSTLPALAELCSDIFDRYDFSKTRLVNNYYDYCFTDFYSLAVCSDLSSEDLDALVKQLEESVPYRYCSNWKLPQEEFYGLSIFNPYYSYKNFIPFLGSHLPVVNVGTYYKTLEWNNATGLVK